MTKKFKLPTKSDLKGRTSTINNAFVIAITPRIPPKESELAGYYTDLGIEEGKCAYCLIGDGNCRDHLKPLVDQGMPTGYITDIHNIVPCCQKCNSSKGSKSFREWYIDDKNVERLKAMGLSAETIASRYQTICCFEDKIPEPLNYEKIVGKKLWNEYVKRKNEFYAALEDNQKFCNKLKDIIDKKIRK